MEISSGVVLIPVVFSILINYTGKRASREIRKFAAHTELFRLSGKGERAL